jgi:hypothetical protein
MPFTCFSTPSSKQRIIFVVASMHLNPTVERRVLVLQVAGILRKQSTGGHLDRNISTFITKVK